MLIQQILSNNNEKKGIFKYFSHFDLLKKIQLEKELNEENNKTIQTIDIDHFWEAYDDCIACKNIKDKINAFQQLYIDKSTEGFKNFLFLRNFSAKEYVEVVNEFPFFFDSIRLNTFEVKKMDSSILQLFENYQRIYNSYRQLKVCFAIGTLRTGGTYYNNYILIGTEMIAVTNENSLTEFKVNALKSALSNKKQNIQQEVLITIAHEYTHSLQKNIINPDFGGKTLLYFSLQEGICDFIAELITGSKIFSIAYEYGDAHEEELWCMFSKEMLGTNIKNWLYNYDIEERPADLGYFIGYKIAQEYYNLSVDKKQALADMVEMNNPKSFLEKSNYARKFK